MSNGMVTQGGARVIHVVQPIVPAPILTREHYPATTSRCLGIFQVVCAVAGIICATMGIVWGANSAYIGYGIWCNTPVVVTGILGIIAANKRTSVILAFLVMSIISVFAVGLMALVAMIALCDETTQSPHRIEEDHCSKCVAVDALILVLGLLLTASLLWSSIIAGNCCQTVPSRVSTVSTVNHATVTSLPPQQGYTVQTGQPQYGPPPSAYQPLPPLPGYQPHQGSLPANPPPYTAAYPKEPPAHGTGYDNYGGN